MKKIFLYPIVLLVFSSCNSQTTKKTPFEQLLREVSILDEYPIFSKYYPKGFSTVKLNEDEYHQYFELAHDQIYYTEEDYNYDEDVRIFGEEKPCFPILRFKHDFLNYIFLIVDEFEGLNTGNIENTYLYTFTLGGEKISKVLLKREMRDLDGIPFSAFGFINKNHFNTYEYPFKTVMVDNKEWTQYSVIVKRYEIKDNGEIILINTKEHELKFSGYDTRNSDRWPEDDPMRLLLKKYPR